MGKKFKIYCDMDGVLTDFERAYKDLTGKDISGQWHDSPDFWKPIEEAGVGFWSDMKWTKDGKELWNHIKKYNPELLSTPADFDDSRVGKNKWVKRELPNTRLILRSAENKKEFADEHSILIDDRDVNIESWTKAGGIGILHESTEDTIEQLKKYGL